jgi:uncharacterized protein YceK
MYSLFPIFRKLMLLTGLVLSGCASIVSGRFEEIHVTTYCDSQRVAASCQLSNENGQWFLNAPGSINIQKGFGDLVLFCRSDYFEPHLMRIASETNLSSFGNILLGAGAGALVDVNNGSGFDYPNDIRFVVKSCGIPKSTLDYFIE